MAVNPAEDIVNVWLTDILDYFTRQNINVPKKTRTIHGKKKGGGRGKEIDILGINTSGKRIWVEVTVSPNPYLATKNEQVGNALKTVHDKFHKEKEEEVTRIFGNKKYEKWFIYSHRIFRGNREAEFLEKVKARGIEAKSFEEIFDKTIKEINHYSVDPTRIYLYYSKKFILKK